jgi:hypothetical protein
MNAQADDRASVAAALDVARLDELARTAALAGSYWYSVALCADRGDAIALVTHFAAQAAAASRDALALARALGSAEPET